MHPAPSTWTFLSNHTHILILLGQHPDLRLRDLAEQVGITERAVQRIVAELSQEGYIEVHREGRRNHYRVLRQRHLRHPIESRVKIGALLDLVQSA
ncbi:MAG TPA: ArsR family transcriptional regulator [Deltaproteobacteria bacterium]|nr:ArsR family transcriptional regulator [Deltaproteobacteria bacterium]